MATGAPAPQLCVVVSATGDGADQRRLRDVLSVTPLACAIITGVGGRAAPAAAAARPLVELIQQADVAALVWQDAALARTLKADGVHLPWTRTLVDDYATAREILDARAIVGVEAGGSRHDAMALGEAGASYVGFGAGADDSADARLDLVTWWAEIFEVPCVAFDVADAVAARETAQVGPDFLAMPLHDDADLARCRDIVATLTRTEARP